MEKRFLFLGTLLLLFGSVIYAREDAVKRFLDTNGFQHASVGISVVRLSDGKSVVEHNPQIALIPASTQKVITTASALRLLGDTYRIKTTVGYSGKIENGILKGDLIIRGGGDPSLGSKYAGRPKEAFFEELTATVKKAGIIKIDGDIIGDESVMNTEGIAPGWSWEDMGNYYAAGIYGLNYNDNLYELILDTAVKGVRPRIKTIRPDIPGLQIVNALLPGATAYDSAYLYGAPFSNERFLYGAVPQNKNEFMIRGDLPEPALQTAQLAGSRLRSQGVAWTGQPRSGRLLQIAGQHIPVMDTPLFTFLSDPLSRLVRQTNVYSLNLFAEGILRQIGLLKNAPSVQGGVRTALNYWESQGLKTDGLFLYDGSGLSPANRVTAGFLTQLMVRMKDVPAFVSSLPLAGSEGTVGSFLSTTPYKGKARLKSGTIKQVIGYTGYIDGRERYAVTVLVNNATCNNREVRRAIEKLFTEMNL
ncbi:MAG: D-alanyl-D-alanine carboxypeptidase/D-alanyl-D-alanine-endopeptidase [Bacteroidales bacterium]